MTRTSLLFDSYPVDAHTETELLVDALDALYACERAAAILAEACLSSDCIDSLQNCIRVTFDATNMCLTTASMLTRLGEHDVKAVCRMLQACIDACVACARECERPAVRDAQRRICAQACRACAAQCRALMVALTESAAPVTAGDGQAA